MKSKKDTAIIKAYNLGYRVVNGVVYNKNKKPLKQNILNGYYNFGFRLGKDVLKIKTHRLVSYQKFGDKIFEEGIQTRHLDSNPLNNKDYNISIGTAKDNSDDKDIVVKKSAALKASYCAKKHNHSEIIKLYNNGLNYEQIMSRLNIKSKGTISFIINKSIESKR